jgi:AcrR family transcriptional regulator
MSQQALTEPDDAPPRPREREILAAIRHVFAERGFDGASMQDLARAAGMSVGNFYRYFPSKAAMIAAIIRRDLEEVEGQFALIAHAPDPMGALRQALHARIHDEACDCDDAPLWAEITAAAMRKPDLAAVVSRMESEIVAYLTRAFALSTRLSPAEAEARFAAHARLIVMLVKANATQAPVTGAEALTALVLRQIDSLLDEIAAAAAQPEDLAR